MIALQPNMFFLNETPVSEKKSVSLLSNIKVYLSVLKDVYRTERMLRSIELNPLRFIAMSNFSSEKDVDSFLIKLENDSDNIEDYLKEDQSKGVLFFPIRHMLKKVRGTNLSVQLLLTCHEVNQMLEK